MLPEGRWRDMDPKGTVNIMDASDDNYAEIMGICILSLLEINRDVWRLRILIVEDGISERSMKRLTQMP